MHSNLNNAVSKKAGLSLLFYLLAIASICLLNKAYPSGPCNPGLGILALMLLPFISAVLLAVNFIKTYKGSKANMLSTIIHLLAIIVFIVFLKTN